MHVHDERRLIRRRCVSLAPPLLNPGPAPASVQDLVTVLLAEALHCLGCYATYLNTVMIHLYELGHVL